jgi:hypothetical protein
MIEALTARVEQLEAARPRDAADAALREQLATSTRGLWFKSAELAQHAGYEESEALAQALLDADCADVGSIGAWLRSNKGTRAGVTIERNRRRCWRARYTCDT